MNFLKNLLSKDFCLHTQISTVLSLGQRGNYLPWSTVNANEDLTSPVTMSIECSAVRETWIPNYHQGPGKKERKSQRMGRSAMQHLTSGQDMATA